MTNLSDDVETLEMIAVVKEKPEKGFLLKKTTISTVLGPNEVLVKVFRASFCGTDYHLYLYDNWAKNRINLPLIVGHEFSGEVIKIGANVKNVKTGDLVSAETHIV
ncbi:MAG: alcohol dehydrogenase catalytic domain-containing protein, partial [Bacilli bacterium]|nr:alcohol dehydrogenase catalytic domain-containing protein [Bacilli bacterium]